VFEKKKSTYFLANLEFISVAKSSKSSLVASPTVVVFEQFPLPPQHDFFFTTLGPQSFLPLQHLPLTLFLPPQQAFLAAGLVKTLYKYIPNPVMIDNFKEALLTMKIDGMVAAVTMYVKGVLRLLNVNDLNMMIMCLLAILYWFRYQY